MVIKLDLFLLISLCFLKGFCFVFKVKKITDDAYDSVGQPIYKGQLVETFSLKQKLESALLKSPCVTIAVPSKGVQLMATRGGMIMAFRDGVVIYGTHRLHLSKSRSTSGYNSPSLSPRNVTPTRSASCTPPVIFSKDGVPIEKRLPKIPHRGQMLINSDPLSSHVNVPRTRITRTALDGYSPNSVENADDFHHETPHNSLEIKPYSHVPVDVSSHGPNGSESSSTARGLQSSESMSTLEMIVDHYASFPEKEKAEVIKESVKIRSRSHSHTTSKPKKAQSCINFSREEDISSGCTILQKAASSPLGTGGRRRRTSKSNAPKLDLTRSDSKRSSSKTLRTSSKKLSPRNDSEPSISPRTHGEAHLSSSASKSPSPRKDSQSNISPDQSLTSSSASKKSSPRSDSEYNTSSQSQGPSMGSSSKKPSPRPDSCSKTSPRSFCESLLGSCVIKKPSPRSDSDSSNSNNPSPRSMGEPPRFNLPLLKNFTDTSPRTIGSLDLSAPNSRPGSPRSVGSIDASSICKNVDINVQLEPGDLILVVVPNMEADANVVLELYLSASDKLEEIDLSKMSTVGQLAVLEVVQQPKKQQLQHGSLAKRRSKSYSTPISYQFPPEKMSILSQINSDRK